MLKRKKQKQGRLQKLILPGIVVFLVLYLLLELFTGQRSLLVWNHLKGQVQDIEEENVSLVHQVDQLERDVVRLKAESLDKDYMDEQIRKNLPVAKSNEQIIQLKE